MTKPSRPTPIRRAFSLLELLIVLAILVVIVGMSWPALQTPWRKSRLRSAAKQLQSELGRARVAAIESSSVRQFRYQPGTPRFAACDGITIALTADSQADSEALDSPTSIDTDQQYLDSTEIDELDINELPSGVIFQDPSTAQSDDLSSDKLSDGGMADKGMTESSVNEAGQMPWSKPITFYPNGRVTGGRFRLADRHGYYVEVTLRGLTGTAKIGAVMRRDRATDEDGFAEEPPDESKTSDQSGESLPVPPAAPAPLKSPAPLKVPAPLEPSGGSGGS